MHTHQSPVESLTGRPLLTACVASRYFNANQRSLSTNEYAYYKTSRMTQLDEELGDISSKISDREFAILDEVRLKVLTFGKPACVSTRACMRTAVRTCMWTS